MRWLNSTSQSIEVTRTPIYPIYIKDLICSNWYCKELKLALVHRYNLIRLTLSCQDAPGARNLRCLEWIRFTGTVNGSGGSIFCISSGSIRLYLDKLIASSWSQSEDVSLHELALDGITNFPKVIKNKNTFVSTFVQNVTKKISYHSYYYKY